MSKALLYATNQTTQAAAAEGTTANFGSTVRKYGCNAYLAGGNATTRGCGYYAIDASVTFEATGAGTEVLQLYKDGVAIPGASASVTVAAADTVTLEVPTVTRSLCDCESTITAILSGAAGTITNAAVRVAKM